MQRLEAAFHRTRPQRRPGPHRPPDALEAPGPKVVELEETAEKSSCAFGDDDHIRFGNALQARRKVGRLAYYAALLRFTRWDQVTHHDEAGCNADPDLLSSARLEPSHRRNQLKPSPYRSLGVVLMGVRIAKVHKDAIPQISGDEPAEVAHGLGDALLIGRNDLSQVLRVHAGGKRRRTDQVREHHRDLAALGGVLGGYVGCRKGIGRWCFRARVSAQGGDGVEQLAAVPDNSYAKVLQVLRCQVRQDRVIDGVLAECSLILSEAKAPQPTSEVHGGAPPPFGAHDPPGETTRPGHCFRMTAVGQTKNSCHLSICAARLLYPLKTGHCSARLARQKMCQERPHVAHQQHLLIRSPRRRGRAAWPAPRDQNILTE